MHSKTNNPVIPGLYADPDLIVAANGKYYLYPTTDGFDGWSGTEFYAFSSKDGKKFSNPKKILDVASNQVPWATGYAWAPCMAQKDGKYYFYFCAKRPNGDSCIGVAVSDKPDGGFHAKEEPIITPELVKQANISMWQTIDPSIYEENGETYILFGNGNPAIGKLSEDMCHVIPETLRQLEGAADFRESIIVTKRKGLYHFTWSCDDTGSENYHVNYGTSDSLFGPIQYQYPILEKQGESLGTGHHSILKIPGKDCYKIAFHRFATPVENYPTGKGWHREICIAELTFSEAGFMKPVCIEK
jgi:beta-xylosidase